MKSLEGILFVGVLTEEEVATSAVLSASSFPRIPTCEGTHIKLIFLFDIYFIICLVSSFLLYRLYAPVEITALGKRLIFLLF